MKDNLENHSKGNNAFWGTDSIPSDFTKRPSKNSSIWPILAKSWSRGGIWKGDILIADLEDLENWMHQIFILEESTRKNTDQTKR